MTIKLILAAVVWVAPADRLASQTSSNNSEDTRLWSMTDTCGLRWFPTRKLVPEFPVDPAAHRLVLGNILGSKDLRVVLGAAVPVSNLPFQEPIIQLSTAGSVHFEVHPAGEAQIVSTEFYVDYLIIDVSFQRDWFARAKVGHTSHHLSDNWYERLRLNTSVNYSRDYVAFYAGRVLDRSLIYAGVNYGYVFHLEGHEQKRWRIQAGASRDLVPLSKTSAVYAALDIQIHEEADWAAGHGYEIGIRFRLPGDRTLRCACQVRRGLDERGQFFPKRRSIQMLGFSIES